MPVGANLSDSGHLEKIIYSSTLASIYPNLGPSTRPRMRHLNYNHLLCLDHRPRRWRSRLASRGAARDAADHQQPAEAGNPSSCGTRCSKSRSAPAHRPQQRSYDYAENLLAPDLELASVLRGAVPIDRRSRDGRRLRPGAEAGRMARSHRCCRGRNRSGWSRTEARWIRLADPRDAPARPRCSTSAGAPGVGHPCSAMPRRVVAEALSRGAVTGREAEGFPAQPRSRAVPADRAQRQPARARRMVREASHHADRGRGIRTTAR